MTQLLALHAPRSGQPAEHQLRLQRRRACTRPAAPPTVLSADAEAAKRLHAALAVISKSVEAELANLQAFRSSAYGSLQVCELRLALRGEQLRQDSITDHVGLALEQERTVLNEARCSAEALEVELNDMKHCVSVAKQQLLGMVDAGRCPVPRELVAQRRPVSAVRCRKPAIPRQRPISAPSVKVRPLGASAALQVAPELCLPPEEVYDPAEEPLETIRRCRDIAAELCQKSQTLLSQRTEACRRATSHVAACLAQRTQHLQNEKRQLAARLEEASDSMAMMGPTLTTLKARATSQPSRVTDADAIVRELGDEKLRLQDQLRVITSLLQTETACKDVTLGKPEGRRGPRSRPLTSCAIIGEPRPSVA
eukprot:TRINITY_DN8167_c1_g1_i1.p1 TRINITY_DN8167_c1_g1~~TRINITY_DN8167_c1_g1_i1.p1  ORF type:complete len:367 (-),score=80.66 TRINITY_DN8167_c1_g1_i1:198-1298(-)